MTKGGLCASPPFMRQSRAIHAALKRELHETEQEIQRMEALMVKIDADILALCQA